MSILTFIGGIHPWDGKELSKEKEIIRYEPQEEVAISMSQHIGTPAKVIVKKGDKVLVGQKIGEANGFVSANIHSSVSGTVKAIESRLMTNGSKAECVIIENDEEYKEINYDIPDDINVLTKEDIRRRIKEAGVVGMGGACFPTHIKLTPKDDDKVEYVIVNGAECEPYLTSDYRRMIEQPEYLVEGLKLILSLFPNAKGIIAIEDNKKDVIIRMKELVKKDKDIEVKELYTKYPQGAERQLIYATTGRQINSSMLPADVGCIVDNVDTVFAVRAAVIEGKPLISRVITVTGDAIRNPQNLLVRIGTNTEELIAAAGGYTRYPKKVISGGPMMGTALFDLNVPVIKGSSALLCFKKDNVSEIKESACINCGKCANVCPGMIVPSRLASISDRGDKEEFIRLNGMECCECGCCSYICPAKRHLTQRIKTMRREILEDRRKK
ncbi:MAG: electron transport complex subunit RsxC [Lachnospiraceae bacterium]|nr:electron transport complex subunit RsxC [Lachnospiraceae bacterium]